MIYYTLDSSQSIVFWSSVDVGASLRTATLTGLSANRLYTIKMLAYSAAGQGPLSVAVLALTNSGGRLHVLCCVFGNKYLQNHTNNA